MNGKERLMRFCFMLPWDQGERLLNAACATGQRPKGLLQLAAVEATHELEHVHNGGRPFPPRPTLTTAGTVPAA